MLVIPSTAHSGSNDIYCKQNFSYSHTSRELVCGSGGGGGGGTFGTETIPAVPADPANDVFTVQNNGAATPENYVWKRVLAGSPGDTFAAGVTTRTGAWRMTVALGADAEADSVIQGDDDADRLEMLLPRDTLVRVTNGTTTHYAVVDAMRTNSGQTVVYLSPAPSTTEVDGTAITAAEIGSETNFRTLLTSSATAPDNALNRVTIRTALQGSITAGSPERTVEHGAFGRWTGVAGTTTDSGEIARDGNTYIINGVDNSDANRTLGLVEVTAGDMLSIQNITAGTDAVIREVATGLTNSIFASGEKNLGFTSAPPAIVAGNVYEIILTNRAVTVGGGSGGGGSVTTTLTEDAGNELLSKLNEIARGDHVNLGG